MKGHVLSSREYRDLEQALRSWDDIPRVARSSRYDEEFLTVVYSQIAVRKAIQRFKRVRAKAKVLHAWWRQGQSICTIARREEFPPVLTGLIIMKEEGISRKRYRSYLSNPRSVEDPRLRWEIEEVNREDRLYAPKITVQQAERGRRAEMAIRTWLEGMGLTFRTESDLRGDDAEEERGGKTPDFLLDRPLNVRGTDVRWIESKASFGDAYELRRNLRAQLRPYQELFGPGMVIYWYGFIGNAPMEDDILVETARILEAYEP